MSLLKTIFKIPTKAQIGFLKLDASIRETHSRTAVITENEIEDGAIINDHINQKPKSLTITGEISDTPISILGLGVSSDDILGRADQFVDGDKSAFEGLISNDSRTPAEAWEYLNQLFINGTPFSIVTSLERYENMVFSSLSAPRDSKNGKNLIFTAELKEVRIVSTSVTTIAAFQTDSDSAKTKNKDGKQSTKEASEEQGQKSSVLLKLTKKIGIF